MPMRHAHPRSVATAVVSAVVAAAAAVPGAAAAVGPGDRPALEVELLGGAELTGRELAGHPVVLAFWAAAHPPSVAALETLAAAEAPGVVYLGVALDADAEAAEEAAARVAAGPAWEHAVNQAQQETVDTRFYDEPYGIPAVWLLDGEGRVLWTGDPEGLAGPLAEAVDAARPAPAWTPQLRDRRIAWSALLGAADAGGEVVLDAAAELDRLGALDPALVGEDPQAAEAAAAVVDLLAGQGGQEKARLAMARTARPGEASALDRLRALAGEEALAAADAREARVDALERAQRAQERGDDAAAMAGFAAIVDGGPEDAAEVLTAAAALAVFQERGLDAEAARAEADAAAAERLLQLARNLARAYQEEKAVESLDELLEKYPDTPSAAEAAELKEKLE